MAWESCALVVADPGGEQTRACTREALTGPVDLRRLAVAFRVSTDGV